MDEKGGGLLAAFDRVAGSGNQENSQFKVEMMLVSGYMELANQHWSSTNPHS